MLGQRKANFYHSSIVLLLKNSFMWQYIAVAGAGAGAEIIDKVRAGAKRQK